MTFGPSLRPVVSTAIVIVFLCAPCSPAGARSHTDLPLSSPAAGAAAARDGPPAEETATAGAQRLCGLIEAAAEENGIPAGFFTRLLWKESSFRSDAVSPKGAQGIAQFMPATAAERGLADPFDTATAIAASARLLSDLEDQFGNLGLAAAAYNAGAERVTNWLADDATLPRETRDYVLWITGRTAEDWSSPADPTAEEDAEQQGCVALVALLRSPRFEIAPEIETAYGPWGVQVAGNFSRARAISAYAGLQQRFPELLGARPPMIISGRMAGRGSRPFHQVRVPSQTRDEAEQICADLKRAGASCMVLAT